MNEIKEILKKYDYKDVLKYFVEISAVPRGSGFNEKISDYLVAFAKKQGLRYVQDEAKNVIIYKPATAGYEEHTGVIIQGHMDMVCVAEEGISHDFETQGLELFAEDGKLGAHGTTLGGDDGIAIAYGLALLADNTIAHPALEVVITTDEETGMDGAKALQPSLISGRYLINVDSEDEGVVLVGCAGGLRVNGKLALKREEMSGTRLHLELTGLLGGHSGAEIHKCRVNAVYQMARLFFELREHCDFSLVSMQGGEKDNAIPCAAQADILVNPKEAENVKTEILSLYEKYKKEFASREPHISIEVSKEQDGAVQVITPAVFERLLFLLIQAPDGVMRMSADIENLVESSLNLGVFQMDENEAEFHFSVRSSISSYKYYIRDRLTYLFEFLGGEAESVSEYPAWEYRRDSSLRDCFIKVFQEFYGKEPKVQAIHAGLECGIICEKIPDMDIISIGPDMHDIHTPRERLELASSVRVYRFLERLLASL